MTDETASLIAELQEATDGLFYISETDSPLTPFEWEIEADTLTVVNLLEITHHEPNAPVEMTTFESFFHNPLREDLYGEDAQRFHRLVDLMNERLTDLKVFRIGKIEIDVYVIGKTKSGLAAGVSTSLVET